MGTSAPRGASAARPSTASRLSQFLPRATTWEGLDRPFATATRVLCLLGLLGSAIGGAWLAYGPGWFGRSSAATVPVLGPILRATLLGGVRVGILALLATAAVVGIASAVLTEGWRRGGPRLQSTCFAAGVVGTLGLLPPAVALAAVAIAVALYVAFIVLVVVVVGAVLLAALSQP